MSQEKTENDPSQEKTGNDPTEITVPVELDGKRLDAVVKTGFGVSWGKARGWIRRGKIFSPGQSEPLLDEGKPMTAGEILTLRIDARRITKRQQGPISQEDILYLDPHIVVVRKPSGLLTVPWDEDDDETLDRYVRMLLSKIPTEGKKSKRKPNTSLRVVHRLDKGTSGLLVFARTDAAQTGLGDQFRAHSLRRRYLALAHGEVQDGTYRSHFVQDRGDGIRGSVECAPSPHVRRRGGGRLAITHVKALEHFPTATLIECRLETGRTNQIRIHLAEDGHPILGETTYMRDFRGKEIPSPRLMLHAASLGFTHPITGATLDFEDPLPNDFTGQIEILRSTSRH